ncbi:MAG: DUF6228 family protein [Pseudomonadota bacterium]
MSNSFSIKSNSSDRELYFSNPQEDYFRVQLKGNVSATVEVYAYTYSADLNEMLQKLASYKKPWAEEESWESLEGEFKLSATCSPLGTVEFRVFLWGFPGAPEEVRVKAGLVTELGQLENIAKCSQEFFS